MTPPTITSKRRIDRSLRTATAALLPLCLAANARAQTPSLPDAPEHIEASEPLNTEYQTSEPLNTPSPFLPDDDDLVLPLDDIIPQSAPPPTPSRSVTSRSTGTVRVVQFAHLQRNGNGDIRGTGGGQIIYTYDQTQKQTTVTAREIDYDAATGQAHAIGSVNMVRDEGTFVGQNLNFNFHTQTGTVTNGIAAGDYFTMRGKVITARGDGTYLVEDGEYTTCIKAHPDYRLRARRLIVKPGDYVLARHLVFYAGSTRLISWPSYRIGLKHAHSAPVPLPGYDNTDGPFVRLHDRVIDEPHHSVDYDARIGLYRLPIGLVGYVSDVAPPAINSTPPRIYLTALVDPLRGILEQISPPTYSEYAENSFRAQIEPRSTFDAVLQNNLGVYNRTYTNLSLTRLEASLRFINILGNRGHTTAAPSTDPDNPQERILGDTESVLKRVPNAPFLLDANFSLSEFHEMPTNVTAGRFEFQSALASQPLLLGRRISMRAGLTNWFHLYTTGTAHDLTSPEVALDYVPTRTSRIGLAYRYVSTAGKTPFEFDARDIRNEGRIQYQVSGPWAFGIVSKIDIDHARSYDTEFAVLRNFDCMQVGINYRLRNQSINLIFNILPPTADRSRRQQLPINPERGLGLNQMTTPTALNPNAVTSLAFGNNP